MDPRIVRYSNSSFYWRLHSLPSLHFTLSSGLPSRILTGNMDGDDYRGEAMDWKHLLAYITGTVDQELLLRNEYLVTDGCVPPFTHPVTQRVEGLSR